MSVGCKTHPLYYLTACELAKQYSSKGKHVVACEPLLAVPSLVKMNKYLITLAKNETEMKGLLFEYTPVVWTYTPPIYIYIWLCMKIPLSAKRVAWGVWFGGMFRGMFRRYDSGYDSPHLLYCLHKDYILYQRALSYTKLATGVVFWRGRLGHGTAKRGLGMIRGMYRVWFAVWFGQETVSAKIK